MKMHIENWKESLLLSHGIAWLNPLHICLVLWVENIITKQTVFFSSLFKNAVVFHARAFVCLFFGILFDFILSLYHIVSNIFP